MLCRFIFHKLFQDACRMECVLIRLMAVAPLFVSLPEISFFFSSQIALNSPNFIIIHIRALFCRKLSHNFQKITNCYEIEVIVVCSHDGMGKTSWRVYHANRAVILQSQPYLYLIVLVFTLKR